MASRKEKNKRVNITGTIIPSQYDRDENIIGISICTDEEEEYIIEPGEICDDLMESINEYVRLTGNVYIDEDYEYYIRVKRYEVIQPMELDFENFEEDYDE